MKLGFQFVSCIDGLDIFYSGNLFGHASLVDDFLVLDLDNEYYSDNTFSVFVSSVDSDHNSVVWHARLDHIGQERMTRLAKEGLLGSLTKVKLPKCEPCLAGKATKKPFGKASRALGTLDLIHSDICGPMNVKARNGAIYFLTLIDDYSRYGYVFLLSHCHEALDVFKRFVLEVETKLDRRVKTLRTDRGREYLLDMFKSFCEEKGIDRHLMIPYTPQQNGVVERRNHTLLDMVRSMMAQANLPISFWGDALLSATYILNRVPSKSVLTTPYELWNGRKPLLDHLRPWGSAGYVHNPTHRYGKLGPRATKMVFIRYPEHSKGYVMYREHLSGGMKEIDSRNVDFFEDEFPTIGEVKQDLQLYELQPNLPLGEGEDMYTNRITEDREFFRDAGDSRSIPIIPVEGSSSAHDVQPENEEDPQSPVNGNEDSPRTHQPTPQGVSGSDVRR